MQLSREVGSGVSVPDVRRVVAGTVGVGAVARRLGVAPHTARRWAGIAGVSIVPHAPTTRMPSRQRVTDGAVAAAIRGPLSLRAAAAALGVTAPGLQARARYLGLPTDPAGRAGGACRRSAAASGRSPGPSRACTRRTASVARPSPVTPRLRELALDSWAAGRTAPEIAAAPGLPATAVRRLVVAARRRGDPRAALRNPGAAWRPAPVAYWSSRAYLDAARARTAARREAREASESVRRMAAIAVPDDPGRGR